MSDAPAPVVAVNPGRSAVGTVNTVLTARTRSYHEPGFRTTLSVKSVLSGEAHYGTVQGRYRVTPDAVAVFDTGQKYTLDIDSLDDTETCAVFFAPEFVADAVTVLRRSDRASLDDPTVCADGFDFSERMLPKSGELARALGRVAAASRGGVADTPALEQGFHDLVAALISLEGLARIDARRFPGERASTRLETYRRLHRALDLIRSCYDEPLTIERLARTASMSPFHFQRCFRAGFGRTPIRALQERRLEVAGELLRRTRLSVLEVCDRVGFASAPTFARLFRRVHGVSPTQWRRS